MVIMRIEPWIVAHDFDVEIQAFGDQFRHFDIDFNDKRNNLVKQGENLTTTYYQLWEEKKMSN